MTTRTSDDVENLWHQHANEYGYAFSEEYPLDTALLDFEAFGYDFMLAQIVAIKDDIETERYHEMLREEEEQDFIDFEKDF